MTDRGITISAVIPTRNRPKELERLLRSLDLQQYPLQEVILVDSSDSPLPPGLNKRFPHLAIQVIHSSPSVCRQRNIGISRATSEFIFACDDDMEVPPEYLVTLADFLRDHPSRSVVSGLIAERDSDGMFRDSPPLSLRRILWNSIFQLGIWGDLRTIHSSLVSERIVNAVKRRLRRRGNTATLAGWPLVVWESEPSFTTKFYGLGASVIRRQLLLDSPYDEALDESGIGDHYGIVLGFPAGNETAVVTSTRCFHHHTLTQRLPPSVVYYRRILALNYFQRQYSNRGLARRLAMEWSLVGNLFPFLLHGNLSFAAATIRAMVAVGKRNPSGPTSADDADGIQAEASP